MDSETRHYRITESGTLEKVQLDETVAFLVNKEGCSIEELMECASTIRDYGKRHYFILKSRELIKVRDNYVAASQDHPPSFAEFILLLIPKRSREHLIGDLEEEFRTTVLPHHGRVLAKCWYFEQVVLAVGFYLWPTIKRILGLTAIFKLIGR